MSWSSDGRVKRRSIAVLVREDGGDVVLCAPAVGMWRGAPAPGTLLDAGACVGELEVLGVLHELVVPEGATGVVAEPEGPRLGERAVGFGDALVQLRPLELGSAVARDRPAAAAGVDASRLVFRAPLSGRFYARASPDKPAFVQVGDEIATGHTVALLEVMKTFNRLAYGGAGLPERARVRAVLVRDEDDVEAGTPILELEPV